MNDEQIQLLKLILEELKAQRKAIEALTQGGEITLKRLF